MTYVSNTVQNGDEEQSFTTANAALLVQIPQPVNLHIRQLGHEGLSDSDDDGIGGLNGAHGRVFLDG